MKKIILASASPRRRELMRLTGLDFQVISSECDEKEEESSPERLVESLSHKKCFDVAEKIINGRIKDMNESEGYLVIGSDTIVVFDGQILGKPKDAADAAATLKRLRGNTHTVFTGVTITDTLTGAVRTFHERTEVTMFNVSDDDIEHYVATGDPLDKAGSYGVQGIGSFLVKEIHGDYFTVVGLPIGRLYHELKAILAYAISIPSGFKQL